MLRSFRGSEHSILGNKKKEEVKMALEATELGPMGNPSSCRFGGLKETSTEKQRGAERKMKGMTEETKIRNAKREVKYV